MLGWVIWLTAADARRRARLGHSKPQREEHRRSTSPRPRRVSRSIARRGLVLLVPLAATVGTGAVIYGLNISGQRPALGVVWLHAGLSGLVLVLVVDKLARLRPLGRRLRLRDPLAALGSVLLVFLLVPLLSTGIVLLLFPGGGSWAAYSHLIASVWWTLALFWHLRRYVAASLATAPGRRHVPSRPAPVSGASPATVAPLGGDRAAR